MIHDKISRSFGKRSSSVGFANRTTRVVQLVHIRDGASNNRLENPYPFVFSQSSNQYKLLVAIRSFILNYPPGLRPRGVYGASNNKVCTDE